MSGKNSTIKIIGLGCGITSFVIILFIAASFFFIKNKLDDLNEMEHINEQMSSRLYQFPRFTDYNSFTIPDMELTKFFNIRDSIKSKNKQLIYNINEMDSKVQNLNMDSGFLEMFGLIYTGINMIPEIMDYYKIKNEQLFINQMSLNEYQFIYATVYFLFAKIPVDSGPGFQISGSGSFNFDNKNINTYSAQMRQKRKSRITKAINKIYRNYFEQAVINTSDPEFKLFARHELEKLKADSTNIHVQNKLRQILHDNLTEIKDKIFSSFIPQLNSFEFEKE